jgi:long-subunit fatty acid transport protein
MRKLLLTVSLSFLAYCSYSQITFGLKSGINIATTKGLLEFPKNRIGWYAGGFAMIPLNNKFFLETELLFSSKGHRTNKIIGGQDKTVTRLNFIDFPIMAAYKIDRKTFFYFGPEIGYLTSAQLIYYSEDFDFSKNYPSKFEIALDVGLMYRLFKTIGIEVRYSYGFKTLYTVDAVGNRNIEGNGGNRNFQIGFNYLLNKKTVK